MKKKIKQRITDALASGEMEYRTLMRAVFPDDLFPRAWKYQSNGGPPGCAMALGRAIREMGLFERFDACGHRFVRMPFRLTEGGTTNDINP